MAVLDSCVCVSLAALGPAYPIRCPRHKMSTARINQAEREYLRFKERLLEIRRGFEPAFWVANITEVFERVAYYGQAAILSILLHESFHISLTQSGRIYGW